MATNDVCNMCGAFFTLIFSIVLVGGGTGAFAEAVYSWHGDRVVVMTSQLFATENDNKYKTQFPQAGILAARAGMRCVTSAHVGAPGE